MMEQIYGLQITKRKKVKDSVSNVKKNTLS